jgi:ATP-binding cassette, subfamily C, bacterial CydD
VRSRNGGPVEAAIASAAGWFRAAGLASAAATLGLVTELFAVATLVSSGLHRHAGHADVRWLAIGALGLTGQVGFGLVAALLAARGASRVESGLRARLLQVLFAPGAPMVGSAVASRLLVAEARKVADAAERWEPLRLQAALVPAVVAAFALATNWLVGVLLLAAAPLIPLNMAVFGLGAQRLSERQALGVAELDALVLDRIKGAQTLRALGAAGRERHRVREASDELARRTLSVLRVALLSSAALEALVTYAVAMAATYIGLVLLGYVHIGWAPTTLGLRGGLFLLLLAPAFFQPFRDLAAAYHDRQDVTAVAGTLAREIGGIPGVAPDGALRGQGAPAPAAASALARSASRRSNGPSSMEVRAQALGLRYPDADADALHNVDWLVPRGAVAGVAGASGAGKTTLLRLVTGRLAPSAGSLERMSDCVAWVSQQPYFFQTSIAGNLLVARPGATEGDLWDALHAAGLAEVIDAIPSGLGTQLGWNGAALSGGEARRLALARALLCGAKTLVLDEPTAHLDPDTEARLIETIAALAPQHTIIVASHSSAVLSRCSQVLHLDLERVARMADVS